MEEFVGKCRECNKEIYCRDGFLDGLLEADHTIICFECAEQHKNSVEA